jgi:hypothetical protein
LKRRKRRRRGRRRRLVRGTTFNTEGWKTEFKN